MISASLNETAWRLVDCGLELEFKTESSMVLMGSSYAKVFHFGIDERLATECFLRMPGLAIGVR